MKRLSPEQRARIVSALVEGNSIRATCRITGAAKGTVLKLLADLGTACDAYQDVTLRNLPCRRVQADEIWTFANAKERNVPDAHKGEWGYGDVWTWTALCADTKLVPSWMVGRRDTEAATLFMRDLASRLRYRVQLTTDGHRPYLEAVESAFGGSIDYSQLIKLYGPEIGDEKRYSPPKCIGAEERHVQGKPDPRHVSTSYVERQNLTMRMSMRRFTRLTNAFTRKVENLEHALALHYMHYNFARVHPTLGMTPAQAAGVSDHRWNAEDIVGLLLVQEATTVKSRV